MEYLGDDGKYVSLLSVLSLPSQSTCRSRIFPRLPLIFGHEGWLRICFCGPLYKCGEGSMSCLMFHAEDAFRLCRVWEKHAGDAG